MTTHEYALHSLHKQRQIASEQLIRSREYIIRHRHGKFCRRLALSRCARNEQIIAHAQMRIQACTATEFKLSEGDLRGAAEALGLLLEELNERSFWQGCAEIMSSFLNIRTAIFGTKDERERFRLKSLRDELLNAAEQ